MCGRCQVHYLGSIGPLANVCIIILAIEYLFLLSMSRLSSVHGVEWKEVINMCMESVQFDQRRLSPESLRCSTRGLCAFAKYVFFFYLITNLGCKEDGNG
jgi:hypothetical protein